MQSLPAGGRYVKEDLVEQFMVDSSKASRMVDELDHMDGNVGAVSQAIAEVSSCFLARQPSSRTTDNWKVMR